MGSGQLGAGAAGARREQLGAHSAPWPVPVPGGGGLPRETSQTSAVTSPPQPAPLRSLHLLLAPTEASSPRQPLPGPQHSSGPAPPHPALDPHQPLRSLRIPPLPPIRIIPTHRHHPQCLPAPKGLHTAASTGSFPEAIPEIPPSPGPSRIPSSPPPLPSRRPPRNPHPASGSLTPPCPGGPPAPGSRRAPAPPLPPVPSAALPPGATPRYYYAHETPAPALPIGRPGSAA